MHGLISVLNRLGILFRFQMRVWERAGKKHPATGGDSLGLKAWSDNLAMTFSYSSFLRELLPAGVTGSATS